MSQSGRPVSGFVRPGTKSGRPGTMEQAIMTPRTAHTARPVTSASGRFVRLGTASMLSEPDGPFINTAQLNLSKYAERHGLNRVLFDYLFYHENDIRNALDLAALATQVHMLSSCFFVSLTFFNMHVQQHTLVYVSVWYTYVQRYFIMSITHSTFPTLFLYMRFFSHLFPTLFLPGVAV